MSYFVALHTGAGNCSEETNQKLKRLCRRVCCEVAISLGQGKSSSDAAILGTLMLEDSPLTNAGLGSSISNDKQIRTEASLCSTDSGFHCVGDLKDIKHPIKIVQHMAEETLKADSHYIPPRVMVGSHATKRYSKIDDSIVQANICTKQSIKLYNKAKLYFTGNKKVTEDEVQTPDISNRLAGENMQKEETLRGVEDTVGIVCVDKRGSISCAMSSGGSVYKYSGRLGQCCTHGGGSHVAPYRGIVTTGNGEQIINKLLAVTLHHNMSKDPLTALTSCFASNETPLCGFLMVEVGEGTLTLHVQHTLSNMVFGFMSPHMEKPVAKVLNQTCPVFLQTITNNNPQ